MPESAVHKEVLFKALMSDEYVLHQQYAAGMAYDDDATYDAYKERVLKRIVGRNGLLKTKECSRLWKEKNEDGSITRAFKIHALLPAIRTLEVNDEIVSVSLWANVRQAMHTYEVRGGEFKPSGWDTSFFRENYWLDGR